MKNGLSSIEINYVLKELNELIGGKVDKIYDIGEDILFVLHIPNIGKKILRIVPGKFLFLSNEKESSREPSSFCMCLRRNLDNARLRSIKQKTPERIVELIFEKEKIKKVYAEFFSQGNLVLCSEEDEIISAKLLKIWRERAILHHKKYDYPKSKFNLFDLCFDDLKKLFDVTEKNSMVTCLAIDLGVGGTYSEEVCLIADIKKTTSPKELKEEDIKKILAVIKSLLNKKISAGVLYDGSEIKDVVPFSLELYKNNDKKDFPTYNSAIGFFYLEHYRVLKAEKSPHAKEIKRIKALINAQEEKIREFEIKEKEERKKAELIYNNYKLINDILNELKSASKKYSWHEIKERLKGHKIIKEVNPQEKSIVIELDDV